MITNLSQLQQQNNLFGKLGFYRITAVWVKRD